MLKNGGSAGSEQTRTKRELQGTQKIKKGTREREREREKGRTVEEDDRRCKTLNLNILKMRKSC